MAVENSPSYHLYFSQDLNLSSFIPEYTDNTNLVLLARALQIMENIPRDVLIPLEVQPGHVPSIAISTLGLAEMGSD